MHQGAAMAPARWTRGCRSMVADIAKLSVGREDYYVREVAENREEYLSGHGESPGRWLGKGAEALGQQGTASSEAFRRIFHGRHPDTGELLGRPHGQRGLPAFDVVFRPVKSVSVLYGLGDTRIGGAVAAAHQQAVVEALGYLEDHVGGRRGHAGARKVDGRGLLAVGFDHRTSRAGDPLLHTHVIVANRVQGPDGRWTALDGRDLWDHRLAADAIYRGAYQRALSRSLGVAWTDADRWGNREVAGVPAELLRAFSKRADAIDLEVERLEAQGRVRTPKLVKWVVHATRQAKQHETPATLLERWRAEAAEHGVDAPTMLRDVVGRRRDTDPAGATTTSPDHDSGGDPHGEDDLEQGQATVALVFDRLAGPAGLAARSPAPTASGWRAWRTGSLPSGRSAWSPTGRSRSGAGRPRSSWTRSTPWSPARWSAGASRPGCARPRPSGRPSRSIRRLGRTRPAWSATSRCRVMACGWWSARPAPARPTRWGSPATPSAWTATACWGPHRPGSRRPAWRRRRSRRSPPSTGSSTNSTRPPSTAVTMLGVAASSRPRCWTPGRCWWWTRPAWSAPASWPACWATPTRPARRSCWSATTASSPRSTPVAGSVGCGCAWGPACCQRTAGSAKRGSETPWSWSATGRSTKPSPPIASTSGWCRRPPRP